MFAAPKPRWVLRILEQFNSPTFRKIAGSIALKVVSVALGFGLNWYLAQLLVPKALGSYFLVLSVITFGSVLSRQGFDRIVVRSHAARSEGPESVFIRPFQNWVSLRIAALAVLVGVILFFLAPVLANDLFNKPGITGSLQIVGFGILAVSLLQNSTEAFKGVGQIYLGLSMWGLLFPLLNVLLLSAMYYALQDQIDWGHKMAIVSYTAAAAAVFLLGRIFWYRATKTSKIDGSEIDQAPKHREEVHGHRKLWLVSILEFSVNLVPTFILGVYVNVEDIGVFELAKRTSLLVPFFLMAFNSVVGPRFAALYKQDKMFAIQSLGFKSTILLVALSAPIVLLIVFFPQEVMSIFGAAYTRGAELLIYMVLGQVVNVVCGPVGILLIMTKRDNEKLYATLSGFAVMVSLCFILIPIMGVRGGAIAVMSGLITQNLMSIVFVYKVFKFVPLLRPRKS